MSNEDLYFDGRQNMVRSKNDKLENNMNDCNPKKIDKKSFQQKKADIETTSSPDILHEDSRVDLHHNACEEKARRQVLADKVLSGTVRLNKAERERAYEIICGETPPSIKRGPKPKVDMCVCLAIEFLFLQSSGMKSKEIMKILGEEFELQGRENVSEQCFYDSVNKGVDYIINNYDKSKNAQLDSGDVQGFGRIAAANLRLAKKFRNKSLRKTS
jgi:hypothetical protein